MPPAAAAPPFNPAGDDFAPEREVIYENTYITKPEGYGTGYRFNRAAVKKVVTDLTKARMEGVTYDPIKAAQQAKELSDAIKEKVKDLGFVRYKIIVQVTIGQKRGQGVRLASRCLWDTTTDNFATEFYENESLFCVAQVYGLYYE